MRALAALTARWFRHRPTAPARRTRLTLHSLEDRAVPAVFNIANGDSNSFIAAINTSNTNNQSDTINLAAGGTYTFSAAADAADGGNALPSILTDSGLTTNTLTINGNGATLARSTVAGTPFFRFLREAIASGTFVPPAVTVNNANFTGGQLDPTATGSTIIGGAVLLAGGNLTLADCNFTGNQAPKGGAVAANQTSTSLRTLNLTRCAFTQNSSTGSSGGAVYKVSSTTLTVADCTFTGNSSFAEGGAIRVQTSSSTTTLTGSLFTANASNGGNGGGAIFIQGTTNIDTTTVRDNISSTGGGGVWVQGTLTVTNTTVSGNRANGSTSAGGGIFVQGDFTMQNSTVFDNRASSGGGISYALGGDVASIVASTVTGNKAFFTFAKGGGIRVDGDSLTLTQSVVAGNTFEATATSGNGPDVGGTVISGGYNFVGNGSGVTFTGTTAGNQVGTTLSPLDPKLGPLQDNGGPTPTRLPQPGSPLVDAGDPAFSAPPAADQRGMTRVAFGRVDIGATEDGQVHVAAATVNGGVQQRSTVTSLTVTFNTLVSFADDAADAFRLSRTSLTGPTGDVDLTVDLSGSTATRTVARLTFSGALTQGGSLIDGLYALTIASDYVSAGGQALDGDGDGVAGGDSVTALHRLFGDANGDRVVNGSDLTPFIQQFGGSNPTFDFNGDGVVNGADLTEFVKRFGQGV